jgi:hypothetical protein
MSEVLMERVVRQPKINLDMRDIAGKWPNLPELLV